mmetsp:Transcript_16558/g.27628  ORF Transcript_16558/g.27628 Transcript_16558/m.27628 type:complete len:862 (-) Transcript_16558:297-2882(-)
MEKNADDKIQSDVVKTDEDLTLTFDSDDDDFEDREGFDELFHRISVSNSIIEFEYHVKNPFKTVRNVRFCLESQALILYDGRHLPADSLLNVSQPATLMPHAGCLVSIRLGSKLKEKKWYFKDADEANRFQAVASALKKNGNVYLDAFQNIKGNNKNNLSWTELQRTASKLDISLTDEQTQAMIRVADVDGKGFLKYLDFFSYFATSSFVVDLESCILEWKQRLDGTLRGRSRRSSVIITPTDAPTPIHKYQATLMKGEIVLNVIQQTRYYFVPTQIQKARAPFIGDIYITNYRLNFVSHDTFSSLLHSRREVPLEFSNVSLPLACISRIDVLKNEAYSVAIIAKDLRMCKIRFEAKESFTKNFHDVISAQAFTADAKGAFAFSNFQIWESCGWQVYDTHSEFERQGVLQSGMWRLWSDHYSICPTYPSSYVLPAVMSNTDILEASKFRSKGRLPALTWRNSRTGALMARSAQPMVGVLGHKSLADKFLLNLYRTRGDLDDRREIDRPSDFYIFDCRRSIAASANTAMGKGVEDVKNYSNTHLIFTDIENIHVMRGSLKSVEEALVLCGQGVSDEAKFLVKLEDSNWLFHLNKILTASVLVAEKMEIERAGVLIHCSDGWDRTAQLCATSQLLLDPYYRTLTGFCVLIEKDWCSFGHKFQDRIGHLSSAESQERSPVFLQWLDVVRLIMAQFPCRFQFNENLLVFIMDAVFSCQFGNFLGNCDKDRDDLKCQETTKSVWSYVLFHESSFINGSYQEHPGPLWPCTSPRKCNLWGRYFFRWIPEMHPRECSGLSWRSDWGTKLSKSEEVESQSQKEGSLSDDKEEGCPDTSTTFTDKDEESSSCTTSDTAATTIKTSRVLSL